MNQNQMPVPDPDWIELDVRIKVKVQCADNGCEVEHEGNRDMFIETLKEGLFRGGYSLNLEDGDSISITSKACDPPTRAVAD